MVMDVQGGKGKEERNRGPYQQRNEREKRLSGKSAQYRGYWLGTSIQHNDIWETKAGKEEED